MIEIIGKEDNIKKRVVCKNCSCILLYLPCDILSYTNYSYDGDSSEYRYIVCPGCKDKIYIKC